MTAAEHTPMNPAPMEPSADLRAFANTLRQMFVALLSEGFTESQAVAIIGKALSAHMGGKS